jgi:hypothetical protein
MIAYAQEDKRFPFIEFEPTLGVFVLRLSTSSFLKMDSEIDKKQAYNANQELKKLCNPFEWKRK